jgi:hypothetical protein
MREISPAVNASVDEYFTTLVPTMQQLVSRIRQEKRDGLRGLPSGYLIDRSRFLTDVQRRALLDFVAALVDENLGGRSDMCTQFADLLSRALVRMGLPAKMATGTAIYYADEVEIFRWTHAWVRIGDEVVDGNVDSLFENPVVPKSVNISPYWGPIREMPADRRLRQEHGAMLIPDSDVVQTWWPELRDWITRGGQA